MSFDAIAPHYRWLEPLLAGRKLDRCRTAHLPRLAPPQSVLVMGEGPGRFLIPFRECFPGARITCIDASKRMLAMAQHRLNAHDLPLEKVSFIHADALRYSYPLATFDLIVTHFFLDCFTPEQLRGLVANLSQAATPTATWLLSDFSIPDAGLPRLRARAIHRLMYTFFRGVTNLSARSLTPPDQFLQLQRFTLQHRSFTDLGLLQSDLWSRSL